MDREREIVCLTDAELSQKDTETDKDRQTEREGEILTQSGLMRSFPLCCMAMLQMLALDRQSAWIMQHPSSFGSCLHVLRC